MPALKPDFKSDLKRRTFRSSDETFRPFEHLKVLLDNKSVRFDNGSTYLTNISAKPADDKSDPEYEKQLFMEAMSDVKPISGKKHIETSPRPFSYGGDENNTDCETLSRLKKLVKDGEGFVVADTPEYIEGTGYDIHPEIARRLHRGDFSVQDHIDLHGLGVEAAQEAFDSFFKEALNTGKRTVLVVHGRGLSSPVKPVLKNRVQKWLTSGPLRKWVIAFTSARACDGGTGATYVLLRERPLTKRFRKKRKQQPGHKRA